LKPSEIFRKLDSIDTVTDEDVEAIITNLRDLVSKIRKARGDEPLPVQDTDDAGKAS
jgi:tetrahydromethanopterin S-methyltransferase subunit A